MSVERESFAHIDANYIALGVSQIRLPTGKDRSRERPSFDAVRRADLLIAVGRGFRQDQVPGFSENEKLSADRDQAVEAKLRLRPHDLAGLPVDTTQRRGRGPSSLRVI